MTKPIGEPTARERPDQREEYEPIRLVELGSVSEMTRGGGGPRTTDIATASSP